MDEEEDDDDEEEEKGKKGVSRLYASYSPRLLGPYRKLRTKFFPLRFMAEARSARAINLCCVSDGFGNDFHS